MGSTLCWEAWGTERVGGRANSQAVQGDMEVWCDGSLDRMDAEGMKVRELSCIVDTKQGSYRANLNQDTLATRRCNPIH